MEWGGLTGLAAVVITSEIYIERYKASFGNKMIELRRPDAETYRVGR